MSEFKRQERPTDGVLEPESIRRVENREPTRSSTNGGHSAEDTECRQNTGAAASRGASVRGIRNENAAGGEAPLANARRPLLLTWEAYKDCDSFPRASLRSFLRSLLRTKGEVRGRLYPRGLTRHSGAAAGREESEVGLPGNGVKIGPADSRVGPGPWCGTAKD